MSESPSPHLFMDALQFHAAAGCVILAETVARLGADNPHTRLVPDMSGGWVGAVRVCLVCMGECWLPFTPGSLGLV